MGRGLARSLRVGLLAFSFSFVFGRLFSYAAEAVDLEDDIGRELKSTSEPDIREVFRQHGLSQADPEAFRDRFSEALLASAARLVVSESPSIFQRRAFQILKNWYWLDLKTDLDPVAVDLVDRAVLKELKTLPLNSVERASLQGLVLDLYSKTPVALRQNLGEFESAFLSELDKDVLNIFSIGLSTSERYHQAVQFWQARYRFAESRLRSELGWTDSNLSAPRREDFFDQSLDSFLRWNRVQRKIDPKIFEKIARLKGLISKLHVFENQPRLVASLDLIRRGPTEFQQGLLRALSSALDRCNSREPLRLFTEKYVSEVLYSNAFGSVWLNEEEVAPILRRLFQDEKSIRVVLKNSLDRKVFETLRRVRAEKDLTFGGLISKNPILLQGRYLTGFFYSELKKDLTELSADPRSLRILRETYLVSRHNVFLLEGLDFLSAIAKASGFDSQKEGTILNIRAVLYEAERHRYWNAGELEGWVKAPVTRELWTLTCEVDSGRKTASLSIVSPHFVMPPYYSLDLALMPELKEKTSGVGVQKFTREMAPQELLDTLDLYSLAVPEVNLQESLCRVAVGQSSGF
jgi:hypothetical protein